MLSVFENVGFVPTRTLDGGVVEVKFPIAPTAGYQARVDERDHVAVTASLRPFFEPGTVAVVGASSRPGSIGGLIFRNLLTGGFTGAAYPVNRSGEPVAGVRAYTSLEAIADPIDLCVICLPGEHVSAPPRRPCAPGRARSASSPPASPRRDRTASHARNSCSRSSALTAPGSSARTASGSRARRSG